MDNNRNFIDDEDEYFYVDTIGRSSITSICKDDYGGLLHELTSEQIDNSVAEFLSIVDSRPVSPQNIQCNDRYVATTEFDRPQSPYGPATVTPAIDRSKIGNTMCNQLVYNMNYPTREQMNIQDNRKQQLTQKEKKLKYKRRICKIDGCQRIVKSQGVCQRHGAITNRCRMFDCDKQAQGNFDGMCSTYQKSCTTKKCSYIH